MLLALAPLLARRCRLEFLLCGSPNEAFYSQIAFFRLGLDALRGDYARARLVAALGARDYPPIPSRWRHHLRRIEIVRVEPGRFDSERYFAASDLRYELLDPRADLSCLCDADTVLLRPFPRELVRDLKRSPAVAAVVAHFPPPLGVDGRQLDPPVELFPGMPNAAAWNSLGGLILGRPPERSHSYTLLEGDGDRSAPFTPNYGFVAGPPAVLARLHRSLREIQPKLKPLVGNDFYGQIGIALVVQRDGIPTRSLPMRFNFPNDRAADRLHHDELAQIVLLHYLRTEHFDRQQIFTSAAEFDRFLGLELAGSDRVFQDYVRRTTGGRYPFE